MCVFLSVFLYEQGAGTAIGELPPYFMARAARLSGTDPDDNDYQKFEEMQDQTQSAQVTASFTIFNPLQLLPFVILYHETTFTSSSFSPYSQDHSPCKAVTSTSTCCTLLLPLYSFVLFHSALVPFHFQWL